MVNGTLVAHAPVDVVVDAQAISGPLTLVVIAETAPTGRNAAAVVVTDDIVAIVVGIVASADPGHRGRLGTGRTFCYRTAATGAQKAVQRTITPVFAMGIVHRVELGTRCVTAMGSLCDPRKRQHR